MAMNSLDDLPQRPQSHDTEEAAETAFREAISSCDLFVVQRADRADYGTDIQIEARSGQAMTNARAHVQLKGTTQATNADGSVSVSVARANLNYLLGQPDSLYACYHLPSDRLLARYAEDIFAEYEHRGGDWMGQNEVTIRFTSAFDAAFQERLNQRLILTSRSSRDRRLTWVATPPERLATLIQRARATIDIPVSPERALELLRALYAAGSDADISAHFPQFSVVLGPVEGAMDLAYLAEINLGLNRLPCNHERIQDSLAVLERSMQRGDSDPASILYCQGNALFALDKLEEASRSYRAALDRLDTSREASLAAQCNKNLGSVLETLGDMDAARAHFEKALELDPDLSEAHLALALWHHRAGSSPATALSYIDQVSRQQDSALQVLTVQGWRMSILFDNGEADAAFRELNGLLSEAATEAWVWPWCAKHVARFGKLSSVSAGKALQFWRRYLREHPADTRAERERLLCLWCLRAADLPTGLTFENFKDAMLRLIEGGDPDPAFLWDRIGHWAQHEGNWKEAAYAYCQAHQLSPDRYGYCYATALNFLGRYSEALPILLAQTTTLQADAMTWSQTGAAHAGLQQFEKAVSAYQRAIELDPSYDLAWFNLGGMYWNSGEVERAVQTWREAITRFPDHELTKKLHVEFSPPFVGPP